MYHLLKYFSRTWALIALYWYNISMEKKPSVRNLPDILRIIESLHEDLDRSDEVRKDPSIVYHAIDPQKSYRMPNLPSQEAPYPADGRSPEEIRWE